MHACDPKFQNCGTDVAEHVLLPLEPSRFGPSEYEAVHAERLGQTRHRLLNVPFHAKGYNLFDVVVTRTEACGCVVARRPFARSGHSTWWVTVRAGVGQNALFEAVWAPLAELGCLYEADGACVAIDAPPEADPGAVRSLLARGALEKVWLVDPENPQGGTASARRALRAAASA